MAESRERLGSRLGFILLSAGCAIGCGNVWKFPWMCGQNGGGIFVLFYLIFLVLLGLPLMTMELSIGRAAQASPVRMYQKIEKPGQKWHLHGYVCLIGCICLMAFYTVVTGWMINYFVKFLTGNTSNIGFDVMVSEPKINVIYLLVSVVLGFGILIFDIQKGLEKVTKYMMVLLMLLMLVLAGRSFTLSGAGEGLSFYLKPDFSKISGYMLVNAMNQAFFTLSLGVGAMAIFGSYINKDRALMGESVSIICLDTFVALIAGVIIFPACYTFDIEPGAGPALLFDTMATVFQNMAGGRWWGALFFLFMVFAALSTELGVFENILACVRELTGWSRKKGCLICGIGMFALSLTTALGFSVIPFHPFGEGTNFLDFWDFIVSTNLLPIGSLVMVLFCSMKSAGWGYDNFLAEANAGKGLKMPRWMAPVCRFVIPTLIILLYIYSIVNFF